MKVLLVSEFTGLGSTGYSNYYREIAKALHNGGHTVVELASYGDNNIPAHLEYKASCPWKVILNTPRTDSHDAPRYEEREASSGDAKFGAWAFDIICAQEEPDVVIAIRDHWYDKFIIESPAAPYFISVLSPTVDSSPQKPDWLDTFGRCDIITTYNQWSEDWLKQQYSCHNMVAHISPSAADDYKILDKKTCRKKLGIPEDIKLVGTVMRNQVRKRFPELFEAMQKCPDTYLYCHTAYPDKGWNIPELLLQNNIQNRVFMTYMCSCGNYGAQLYSTRTPICKRCGAKMETPSAKHGLPNAALCEIYNSMDLYLQPASNEGFGIPLIEAAKCGVKCVTTDYSAQVDVIRKIGGIPMKPIAYSLDVDTCGKRAVIDIDELANVINDPNSYNYSKQSIRDIYDQNYSWEKTGKRWLELVNNIKPKNLWGGPPQVKQPLAYEELASRKVSNEDFLILCVLHVACDETLLGSHLHVYMLDSLNSGYIMSNAGEGSIIPVDRKLVYNKFRSIRENINTWENQKSQIKRSFQKS